MLRTAAMVQTGKELVARSTADGSPGEMPVFVARPAGGAGERRPGILLLQEIFGVNEHIQDVAQRFAAMGYVVVAPDLMYRKGHWQTYAYTAEGIAAARSAMAHLNEELVVGDMAAALDFLAAQPDVDAARVGTVGYCFGGRASLVAAIALPGRVAAAAVYYGGGIVRDEADAPVSRVAAVRCPVIGFFAGQDKHIPVAHVRRLSEALDAAGVENRIYCYMDADHGFFCDARQGYQARAAQDAWHRTQHFLARHLGPVPAVAWAEA